MNKKRKRSKTEMNKKTMRKNTKLIKKSRGMKGNE